jgi:hypothetical protein
MLSVRSSPEIEGNNLKLKKKKVFFSWGLSPIALNSINKFELGAVAHIYNPSYSGDGDWKDSDCRPARAKKLAIPHLDKYA